MNVKMNNIVLILAPQLLLRLCRVGLVLLHTRAGADAVERGGVVAAVVVAEDIMVVIIKMAEKVTGAEAGVVVAVDLGIITDCVIKNCYPQFHLVRCFKIYHRSIYYSITLI